MQKSAKITMKKETVLLVIMGTNLIKVFVMKLALTTIPQTIIKLNMTIRPNMIIRLNMIMRQGLKMERMRILKKECVLNLMKMGAVPLARKVTTWKVMSAGLLIPIAQFGKTMESVLSVMRATP